jgi:hypothetical protein
MVVMAVSPRMRASARADLAILGVGSGGPSGDFKQIRDPASPG